MNRDYLKQIMIDQKEMYLNNSIVRRNYQLEDNVNYCFVGIRRTGKSYMMYQLMKNLQDEYDSCVLYHLLLIAVNFSFHPENPTVGKNRIKEFQMLTRQEIFEESLKNVHPENFSTTRKVTLICIQLHLYRIVQMIARIRHRQRGR